MWHNFLTSLSHLCQVNSYSAALWNGLFPAEVVLINLYYYHVLKNRSIFNVRCRLWSDAAFCVDWSGSTLFANVPSSFPQYFQYISNFRGQITYSFLKCGCSIYFFLNSTNLVCRVTDISKHYRESLGLQENDNRLLFVFSLQWFGISVFYVHI